MAHAIAYACKCLNIRCNSQPASGTTAHVRDPQFFPIYVGDQGITTAHNQLTLRTRTPVVRDDEKSQRIRYMSLTCLVCETLVYRVLQPVSADAEDIGGPVLPTEDWAEQETLKSLNGWIEVHTDCLTENAIKEAESSPYYSRIFQLVLPPESPSSPSVSSFLASTPPLPASTLDAHLPSLPHLFPPAPFTPSHPTFTHLASLASDESTKVRLAAEHYLAVATQEKVSEITHFEEELRRQVESLWRKFRKEVLKVEQETTAPLRPRRRESDGRRTNLDAKTGAPVPVRSFVPVRTPTSRTLSSSPSAQAHSGLSASLATSSFLQQQPDDPSPPDSLNSAVGPATKSRSSPGTSVLAPFQRNMDEAKDIATSFKYVSNLDRQMEDAAAARRKGPPGSPPSQSAAADKEEPRRSPSQSRKPRSSSRTREPDENTSPGGQNKEGDLKGRRKVTFNVRPAVVTITRELNAEKEARAAAQAQRRSEDMMFDLDDETNGRAAAKTGPAAAASPEIPGLPFNESTRGPARPRGRRRKSASQGLPDWLSSLRPASLPAPTNMRPRSHSDQDARSPRSLKANNNNNNNNVVPQPSPQLAESKARDISEEDDAASWDPREAEILKLVAAETPSHRGAWRKDSKAWQTFVRRQDGRAREGGGAAITEEDEDEPDAETSEDDFQEEGDSELEDMKEWTQSRPSPLGSSLPIAIGPLSRSKKALGIQSYQPKTSLSDRPGVLVPALRPAQRHASGEHSSSALRKASYAERDRIRERDPGALDFTAEDDSDEDDSENGDSKEAGSLSRQRAFKILQARSKVPSAGMWRSLAD